MHQIKSNYIDDVKSPVWNYEYLYRKFISYNGSKKCDLINIVSAKHYEHS